MIENIFSIHLPMGVRLALAFFIPVICCFLFGARIIRMLISLKLGQPIRSAEEVHKLAELHGAKAGTPTMGGIMILGGTILGTVLLGNPESLALWLCLGATLVLSLLGYVDDFLKIKFKSSDGIAGRLKLLVQAVVGLIGGAILYYGGNLDSIFIPFYGYMSCAAWVFIPFAMVTIMACSNAVNLTDGLDGLAAGCTLPTCLAYAVIALGAGTVFPMLQVISGHTEIAVFLVSLAGACVGFLWFNCYPAKVFMGDTGSLAIGGGLGMAAVCLQQQLLFIVVGVVFFMEAMSVLMQVGYFKLTKGKRIFKMAPIHHHFELAGWKETQVFQRFWILALFSAILGLTILTLS